MESGQAETSHENGAFQGTTRSTKDSSLGMRLLVSELQTCSAHSVASRQQVFPTGVVSKILISKTLQILEEEFGKKAS